MRKYIAYYRVSTKDQEQSGLGLEAQRSMVERFIDSEKNRNPSLSMCLFTEFTDIETGTKSKVTRPGLNNAIYTCRQLMRDSNRGGSRPGNDGNSSGSGSGKDEIILLIAKLDRLSRNLNFITMLQESNIKFVCCDMPNADNTTIHIFGAIAQREAEMISSRTKDALAEFKKKNKDGWIDSKGNFRTSFANPGNLTDEGRKKAGQMNRDKSINDPNNIRTANYGKVLKEKGLIYSEIATRLNKDGFRTVNGLPFTAIQVHRLVKPLIDKEEAEKKGKTRK